MTMGTKKTTGIATLTLSIVFFGLGIYFPLLSTHKQLIFRFDYQEINIFQSIAMFFESKEYFFRECHFGFYCHFTGYGIY